VYIGKTPIVGNFQKCDAISVVNGQAAYTLQVSSTNVVPESANHMLVSLNGILQAPVTSFSVSGSTLTFASNLATGDVIDFVILLGNVLDLGVPSDASITNAKLAQDIISGETALTVSPATTDELLISDAGTLKRIDFSLLGNGPVFFAQHADSAATAVSDNTETVVPFAVEKIDTHSAFASNVFTVPANEGGTYYLYWMVAGYDAGGSIEAMTTNFYVDSTAKKHQQQFTPNGYRHTLSICDSITIALSAAEVCTVKTIINTNDSSDGGINGGGAGVTCFGGFKLIGV
jgi:hypothetical protein